MEVETSNDPRNDVVGCRNESSRSLRSLDKEGRRQKSSSQGLSNCLAPRLSCNHSCSLVDGPRERRLSGRMHTGGRSQYRAVGACSMLRRGVRCPG